MFSVFLICRIRVLDQTNNSQLMLGKPIPIFRDGVEHLRILGYCGLKKHTQYHYIILNL